MDIEDDGEPERKLRIASRLYAYSEGKMKLTDAMKVAGYATPERKRGTVYQRVRRTAAAISTTNGKPPATILLGNNQNDSYVVKILKYYLRYVLISMKLSILIVNCIN